MAASSSSEKRRCHYEVLGVGMESTAEEIRSAYRKLALQLHPDKLMQSGLSQSEATAKFQELSHSYEVLSDPKERSWYDSHRSKILFASAADSSSSVVPDLFSFFSNSAFSGYSSDNKKNFFRVYSDVFTRVYANELEFARRMGAAAEEVREAPAMGDLDSPYAQAAAFYAYWTGFTTVMDFAWAEPYDAAAGENRKSRRLMEEENKKARRKAKREYSDTVRGLAEFAKKRDKRVIDMGVKRKEAEERRRAEERDRRKREEKEKLERAMAYRDPEWAQTPDEDSAGDDDVAAAPAEEEEEEELYCVACGKKFKSEKQWKNHEQSKKHRENVDRIRKEFVEEQEQEQEPEPEDKYEDVVEDEVEKEAAEEIEKMMREKAQIEEEEEEENDNVVEEKEEEDDKKYEDEIGVLEAMLGGRRNRKKAAALESNDDVVDGAMEYNDRKSTRKSRRRAKKGKNGEPDCNGNGNNISATTEEEEEVEEKKSDNDDKKSINEKSEVKASKNKAKPSKGKKAKVNYYYCYLSFFAYLTRIWAVFFSDL